MSAGKMIVLPQFKWSCVWLYGSQAPDDADDDFHRIPTPQHLLTLEGFTGVQDQPYNGPPFPPVHPPDSVQLVGGVLEADTRQEEALQERAMEW